MKIYHRPEIDYVSIDFSDKPESKSVYENGVIVRYDKKNQVVGIDITDSTRFFLNQSLATMKEACQLLGVSESTLRRMIRSKKLSATKPNGKDYRFKKSDLMKIKTSGI